MCLQTNVQNVFEDAFKIAVAQWVYEGVEGGVDITEPYGEHVKVMMHTISAERRYHEGYEIRYPAEKVSSDGSPAAALLCALCGL